MPGIKTVYNPYNTYKGVFSKGQGDEIFLKFYQKNILGQEHIIEVNNNEIDISKNMSGSFNYSAQVFDDNSNLLGYRAFNSRVFYFYSPEYTQRFIRLDLVYKVIKKGSLNEELRHNSFLIETKSLLDGVQGAFNGNFPLKASEVPAGSTFIE